MDPLGPLPQQKYYHGSIRRVEAEALLVSDGEFLVRESSKNPGQFVLTGMAKGLPQHLLLMDKYGKVSCTALFLAVGRLPFVVPTFPAPLGV